MRGYRGVKPVLKLERTHGITTRELLRAPEYKCLDVDCWLSCCGGLKIGTDSFKGTLVRGRQPLGLGPSRLWEGGCGPAYFQGLTGTRRCLNFCCIAALHESFRETVYGNCSKVVFMTPEGYEGKLDIMIKPEE